MTDLDGGFVTNIDSLAAQYAKPTERLLKKRLDHVNAPGRAFIAASPFLVLAPEAEKDSTVRRREIGLLLIARRRGAKLELRPGTAKANTRPPPVARAGVEPL